MEIFGSSPGNGSPKRSQRFSVVSRSRSKLIFNSFPITTRFEFPHQLERLPLVSVAADRNYLLFS